MDRKPARNRKNGVGWPEADPGFTDRDERICRNAPGARTLREASYAQIRARLESQWNG